MTDLAKRCAICGDREARGGLLCRQCADAYNRWNRTTEGTTWDLIEWVAKRARYFEMKRRMRGGR